MRGQAKHGRQDRAGGKAGQARQGRVGKAGYGTQDRAGKAGQGRAGQHRQMKVATIAWQQAPRKATQRDSIASIFRQESERVGSKESRVKRGECGGVKLGMSDLVSELKARRLTRGHASHVPS